MEKQKGESFMLLYKPVHAKFEKFCMLRAYGQYEFRDLMQETIAVAYSKFSKFESSRLLLSFLCGIAIKTLANHNRKIKTMEWTPALDLISGQKDEKAADDKELLYFALSKIPDEQKDAIILFEIAGFSIKEIATIQSTGESATKQRLARGRAKLLEILESIEMVEKNLKTQK